MKPQVFLCTVYCRCTLYACHVAMCILYQGLLWTLDYMYVYVIYTCIYILYMGNNIIWQGEILANHASKSYWRGKIWRISNSQCIWYIRFLCICEYWWGKFWWMAHDLPNLNIGDGEWLTIFQICQFFPYQDFPMYSTYGYAWQLSTCIGQQ